MSEERIDAMRAKRGSPQVILHRYNKLRSSHPGKLVCAFEGGEDVSFYDAMFHRIDDRIRYVPMVCGGKDHVLALADKLAANVSTDAACVRYFVDWDFDGLKGQLHVPEIYFTPSYSFENLLVERTVLEKLLRAEYRCHDEEHGATDIEQVCQLFDARLEEFFACMKDANHLLFCGRRSELRLGSVETDMKKFLAVSPKAVRFVAADVHPLLGYANPPDEAHLAASKEAFEQLDPLRDWRGKFVFWFFCKFLADLKDDRGTKKPEYFAAKATVSFSPTGDVVRSLASMAKVPDCLKRFAADFPAGTA